MMMDNQTTSTLLMIRPVSFRGNEQTVINNYYQQLGSSPSTEAAQKNALKEFNGFVELLRKKGINVIVIEAEKSPDTPDSIFPNNWVSFHQDGRVALYPMYAHNRRLERRDDILGILKTEHGLHVKNIVDFTNSEYDEKFLEGTGSMILDRQYKWVYAALSERTDMDVLTSFCEKFNFQAVSFNAYQTVDGARKHIYHTNVMMCLGEKFAVICLDCIDDNNERSHVVEILNITGKEIIEISEDQVNQFAGNMLHVKNIQGKFFVVMSSAAFHSLTSTQIERIENHGEIIHSPLNTIEKLGGGSARCMMAEVFLPKE